MPLDRVAGVLVGEADAALHAEAADDLEDDVLGVDAAARACRSTAIRRTFSGSMRQALRRQHVAHLRRADAERDRAERAVRRGVAVAAGDRHPRLRQPELRPDDVDDALRAAVEIEQRDAVLAAVALERRQHVLRHHVEERPPLIARRHDVIDRRDRARRIPHRPARAPAACRTPAGVVTSWMRCSPMNSCVWPLGSLRTVCASQTFWRRVEPA